MVWGVAFFCVLAIGSCHWLASLVVSRPEQHQQRWASVGGGAGLAYVFLHLLPELATGGSELSDARGLIDYVPTPLVEALLFLVALLGVLVVFSLNVVMKQRQDAPPFAV